MAHEEWNWTIGTVAAPFGIRGELKVRFETDFPERFEQTPAVFLRPKEGTGRVFQVERARPHKGQVLLKLKGIDTMTDAEAWRGAAVQVPRSQAVDLPPDSYWTSDIIGFEVVTGGGRRLGTLDEVLPYPAQDLLRVGEALIPAVRPIVVRVDVEARRIVVNPPEGLLPGEEPEHAD